jgi:hypothetical protein
VNVIPAPAGLILYIKVYWDGGNSVKETWISKLPLVALVATGMSSGIGETFVYGMEPMVLDMTGQVVTVNQLIEEEFKDLKKEREVCIITVPVAEVLQHGYSDIGVIPGWE